MVVFPQLGSDLILFGKTTASLKPERRVEATLIGGKVEGDEIPMEAAWREFEEEAGKKATNYVKVYFNLESTVTVEANGWTYMAFIFVPENRHLKSGDEKGVFFESLMKLAEKRAREGLSPLGELYGFCAYPVDQLVEKELRDYGRYPLDDKTNLVKYYDPLVLAVAKACREL